MPYIIPRKKKENESRKENLTRRLEENIEFYHACGRMSHVAFLEQLKDYVYHSNPPKDGEYICPECSLRNYSGLPVEYNF